MNALADEFFGSQLSTAKTFDAALDRLAEVVTDLGFDAVDYAYLPTVRSNTGGWVQPKILARNFPARWERGWMIYGRHDPIYPACYRKGLPLDWDEVKQRHSLTQAQLDSIAYVEFEMGFPEGITVPIHLPNNRFAFVSAVSTRTGTDWQELRTRAMSPLMVIAHTFHHVTSQSFPPYALTAPVRLSRREIECLNWAAAGKNAPETALILNRSVDTARRHLKSAMAKLEAKTIAHAVAIACAMGVLEMCGVPEPLSASDHPH